MIDLNGNEILVGSKLRSNMHPENEVVCVAIDDEGIHLKQKFKGTAPFIMPNKSLWVVYEQPLKEEDNAENREEDRARLDSDS